MNDCPVLDDSDGITLQSLGGVFIATLIGLGIALITLGVEVALKKKKDQKVSGEKDDKSSAGSTGFKNDGYREDIYGRAKKPDMPSIIGN